MRLDEITHHTSVSYLFHGTQPERAASILSIDELGADNYTVSLGRIFGVSLSFTGFEHFPGVVFVIDRNILKRKIGRRLSHLRAIDQYEEEVKGKVTDFDECVVKIFICVTQETLPFLNSGIINTIRANPKSETRLLPRIGNNERMQELLTYRQFLNISKEITNTAQDRGHRDKVENFIMHDLDSAVIYAEKELKGRWPALEKSLLQSNSDDAPWYASQYAKKVIKNRWPDAENLIASSKYPHVAKAYAKDILRDPEPTTWAERYLNQKDHH